MEDTEPSWDRLAEQARSGDQRAGKELVELLYPTVIRIVRTHRPAAMDENYLVQEVYLKVFAKLDTFRGLQPLPHWVARIARNLCFDHLRKKKRRGELRYADLAEGQAELLEASVSREIGPHQASDSPEEVRHLISRLLDTLKEHESQVLRMLDLEELPVKEIAAQLGWGESRVKVTAFRARKKLRETMKNWEGRLHE